MRRKPWCQMKNGANDRNRTDDLLITSELLYRLSYVGSENEATYPFWLESQAHSPERGNALIFKDLGSGRRAKRTEELGGNQIRITSPPSILTKTKKSHVSTEKGFQIFLLVLVLVLVLENPIGIEDENEDAFIVTRFRGWGSHSRA